MATKITIAGEPVAQGRPRAAVINGKARVFDPKKSRSWKGMARVAMQDAGAPYVAEGPVAVIIRAYHRCPKGDRRKTKPAPRRWRAKRPDLENIAKAVLDAATSVLWADDAQVAHLVVEQFTAGQDEPPRVELEVLELGEEAGPTLFFEESDRLPIETL